MKKSLLILATFLIGTAIYGQSNAIDALFDRYSEQDGFTSVFISGRMLSMLAGFEAKSERSDNILFRLKSIRILTQDSLSNIRVNSDRNI